MARKKVVVEKNYDELIKVSEEKIVTLTSDLKEEKANLKNLKKEKIAFDKAMEKKKKDEEIKELTELIIASGKTPEEIKELLNK